MIKHYCDICKEEITENQRSSRYKLKREEWCWDDHWWTKLHVHDECWRNLNQYLKELKEEV